MKKQILSAMFIGALLAFGSVVCAQERMLEIVKSGEVVFSSPAAEIDYLTVVYRLAAPTNVRGELTPGAIVVKWNAVSGATSYKVYRSSDGVNFSVVGTSDNTTYTDNAPLSGSNYYCVQALGDNGAQSEMSASSLAIENGGNTTFTVNGVSFDMVYVEGGTFTMGATSEQDGGYDSDETPTHSVTLSSYYVGATEVTQALWEAVMGTNPSNWTGDNLPVEKVSWDDCQTFITKLNQLTGKTFALPTEAQWEYAARGGKLSKGYKYSGSNTIGDVAWYQGNSSSKTHAVGTKAPNELGIYDMSGNVWEWCSDWYGSYSSSAQTNPTGASSGSYRVNRGGTWSYNASYCRVSNRDHYTPSYSSSYIGFRVVLFP